MAPSGKIPSREHWKRSFQQRQPKRVLALPDLEHAKTAILNCRAINRDIRQFRARVLVIYARDGKDGSAGDPGQDSASVELGRFGRSEQSPPDWRDRARADRGTDHAVPQLMDTSRSPSIDSPARAPRAAAARVVRSAETASTRFW